MNRSKPPYHPIQVANTILRKAGIGTVSPMKLQKLMYFAHGWGLAISGTPLVDEPVEAWVWGPVFPTVYRAFKEYGNSEIDSLLADFHFGDQGWDVITPEIPEDDETTQHLIERVIEKYGGFTPAQLSNLTHLDGTPWSNVRPDGCTERSLPIPENSIKEYFVSIGKRERQKRA